MTEAAPWSDHLILRADGKCFGTRHWLAHLFHRNRMAFVVRDEPLMMVNGEMQEPPSPMSTAWRVGRATCEDCGARHREVVLGWN